MMVTNSLSAHPRFKTLDPESCRILDRLCTWLKTAARASAVARTANGGNVYFVMAGRLRPAHHGMRRVMSSEIEAGCFFGELGARKGLPRWHGVFAVNDSTVAAMPSVVFVETVVPHRPLGEAVAARLAARNRAMTRRVAEAARTYQGRLPLVGPMRSRPPYGGFRAGVDVRHIGEKHRQARLWS